MDTSQSPSIDMAQFNSQNTMDSATDFANFLDYNQLNSPAPQSSKALMLPQTTSTLTSPTSALSQDMNEDQMLMRPSHDYGRFKQQTGLPVQANVHAIGQFSGFNSGVYESQMWEGMPSQAPVDPNFEAFLEMSANDDFIDPNAIMKQEEVQANIRYFPGMHQQAAIQKQAMMAKQKQQREAEQQRQQQAAHASVSRRSGSQQLDPRTEETISRVMSQIRRSSNLAADSLSPPPGSMLPHIIKAKKDEEDMDEDERLLNSEEGKKLSSKERRQLRNKVSARAFRSRRKEYIGQLEGEVAAKVNEAAELKRQNQMLMEENARFRSLAEKLLSHNAFRPFLEELSRDPELADSLSKVVSTPMPAAQTAPQIPKDIDPFANSQQFLPQNNNTHVGMTMIPEMPVDLSSLNIGTNAWNAPHGMPTFQQPSVFAVTELPQGPSEPIDFEALSGKDSDKVLADLAGCEEEKPSYPEVEAMPSKTEPVVEDRVVETTEEPEHVFDENDESVTLFASSRASRSAPVDEKPEFENLFGSIAPEKVLGHFELIVRSEGDNQTLDDELSRMTARLEASCSRVEKLVSRF